MTGVVYVDPDEETREAVGAALERAGAHPIAAQSLTEAEAALDGRAVDCVVSEYELPDGTGLELVDRVRAVAPDTACLLYTAADADDLPTDGAAQVVDCYFKASTTPDTLAAMVEAAIELRSHTAYPLPANERDRLAAIESFDFDAERLRGALKRVTDLAARHYGLDRASVNIIDASRQTFLACHGTDWTDTTRDESICTYAIVDDDPVTVIEDTAADPRFEANEELRELGIRFYAGADVTVDGVTLGTLCVYGKEPGAFDDADREYLALLADEVADLLAVHRDLGRAEEGVA